MKNVILVVLYLFIGVLYGVQQTPEKVRYRHDLAEDARAALFEKRMHAIGECGTSRFQICYRPLVANLEDPTMEIREASARALGKLNLKFAAEPLNKYLPEEKEAKVKYAMIWALGMVGNEKSSELLTGLLGDEDPEIRRLAAFSLSNLAEESSLEAINGKIEGEEVDVTKAHLLRASLRIKRPQSKNINELVKLLQSEDNWARYHAAKTIGELRFKSALKPLGVASRMEENPETRKRMQWALIQLR